MKPAWDKLVLLAGHPRGGTTWLGAVLSAAAETHYIFEPQLIGNHPRTAFSDKVEEYNKLSRWHLSAEDDFREYKEAFIGHLRELVQAYFDCDHVHTLAIKMPETERLPWLLKSLAANKLVYIQRHPLGIINSYENSRIYWTIREKWGLMLREVNQYFPELLGVLQEAGDCDLSKTIAMIYVRYRFLHDVILSNADFAEMSYIASYELLATDPLVEYKKVYSWLGWQWTDAVDEKTHPYFNPKQERKGFLEVRKKSKKRILAWRRELAPWQIRRVADFFFAVGADYPVPGAGFSELTSGEKIAATSVFVSRRGRHSYRRLERLIRSLPIAGNETRT